MTNVNTCTCMCKHDTMYPGGVCAQMCVFAHIWGCVYVHIYTYTYMLIHVCMHTTRYLWDKSGTDSGGSPGHARGGSQTAVISEKGRFLRFVMTGLVPQGCVFEMQKGRPIVLLIRVLWTRIVDRYMCTKVDRYMVISRCVI